MRDGMVDETQMTHHNGKPIAPPVAVARTLNCLAHDVVELAELQGAMFKFEMQGWWKKLIAPAMLLVISVVIAMGCVPVLLFGLAYGLSEATSLSMAVSLLIVAASSLVVAVILGLVGWSLLKACSSPFSQSTRELSQNLRWIKATLKHSAPPSEALRTNA
jgi:hypothetical protein